MIEASRAQKLLNPFANSDTNVSNPIFSVISVPSVVKHPNLNVSKFCRRAPAQEILRGEKIFTVNPENP